MIYKGVVSSISSFDYQGKKLWSFQLNNDRSVYYRTGNTRPRAEEGQFVVFEGTAGKGNSVNVDTKSIQVKAAEAEATGVAIVAKAPASSGGSNWPTKEEREATQKRIEIQSCRNSALEFIKILTGAEALKVPTKQAEKVEFYENLLSHYIDQFLKDNSGESTEGKEVATDTSDQGNDQVPY